MKKRKAFRPERTTLYRIVSEGAAANALARYGVGPLAPQDGRSVERLLADAESGRKSREANARRGVRGVRREFVRREARRLMGRDLSDAAKARVIARKLPGWLRGKPGFSERMIREELRALRPALKAPARRKLASRRAASRGRKKPSRRK